MEQSFAHVCETGGGRRTSLRGRVNVSKRYLISVATHNLGVVMRSLFGVGKPRVLQGRGGAVFALVLWLWNVLARIMQPLGQQRLIEDHKAIACHDLR